MQNSGDESDREAEPPKARVSTAQGQAQAGWQPTEKGRKKAIDSALQPLADRSPRQDECRDESEVVLQHIAVAAERT